jgi:hypothetical protein
VCSYQCATGVAHVPEYVDFIHDHQDDCAPAVEQSEHS